MPEHAGRTRAFGALSAGLLALVLAAPVALAQTEEVPPPPAVPEPTQPTPPPTAVPPEQPPPGSWDASSFEAPFDKPDAMLGRETFDIAGTLRYQKTGPADFVRDVEVRVVDDPVDSFAPVGECPMPDPVAFRAEGPQPGLAAEHAFFVEGVTIPCNGRYLVQAEGRLEDPEAPSHTMQQSFLLAVMPAAVTGLGVTVDSRARSVTATFEPLPEDLLAPDATGYVLERSGSAGDTYVDVATIDLDDEPEFVDPLTGAAAGAYTYRVRAVRAGAEGDVRSSVIDSETDTVDVPGEPKSSAGTVTGARSTRIGGSRPGARPTSTPRRAGGSRPTTSTTLDTGYEDSLDYGEPGSEEAFRRGDDPQAGQSIVQDEADGMGLAVPAAGALVMLGWAGHILYLNRLAKQL